MPSTVIVHIERAQNLPIMDKKRQTTDAYVEVFVPGADPDTKETEVFEGSLNPEWRESFKFEVVDDSLLQDQTILFTLYDDNKLQQDKTIGAIRVDLNCLLMHGSSLVGEDQKQRQVCGEIKDKIEGWFQIYDSLRGMVGELYVSVELVLVEDHMKYDESATTVQFFAASLLSTDLYAEQRIYGFVEDLVVDKDPEYHWSDSLRSSRVTNEKRLNKMFGLSCSVRRQIAIKAKEMGCNAVVGYHQHFDIEGDSGIVSRGSGTACLIRTHEEVRQASFRNQRGGSGGSGAGGSNTVPSPAGSQRMPRSSFTAGLGACPPLKRGVSSPAMLFGQEEDVFGDGRTKRDQAATNSPASVALAKAATAASMEPLPPTMIEALEQPSYLAQQQQQQQQQQHRELKVTFLQRPDLQSVKLLTMESFPPSVHFEIGGLVSAYAVKWLGRLRANDEDEETRDGWWLELRAEVKENAMALACTHVVGYKESCSINGDVCLLSCIGTAVNFHGDLPAFNPVHRTSSWQAMRSVESSGGSADTDARVGLSDRPRLYSDDLTHHDNAAAGASGLGRPTLSPSLSAASVAGTLVDDIPSLNIPPWHGTRYLQQSASPVFHSCGFCHVPNFPKDKAPFNNMTLFKCQLCEHDRPVRRGHALSTGDFESGPTANVVISPTSSPSLRPKSHTPTLSPVGVSRAKSNSAGSPDIGSATPGDLDGLAPPLFPARSVSLNSTLTSGTARAPVQAAAYVPEFILASIEPPEKLPTVGKCHLIEARVARVLPTSARGGRTEYCAEKVSTMIPFLLYDLHRQLLLKMRFMQVNTAWALFTQIKIGERLVVGLIRATGVLVPALPLPYVEVAKDDEDDEAEELYGTGMDMHGMRMADIGGLQQNGEDGTRQQDDVDDVKARLGLIQEHFEERHRKIRPLYERYYQDSMRLRQSFRRMGGPSSSAPPLSAGGFDQRSQAFRNRNQGTPGPDSLESKAWARSDGKKNTTGVAGSSDSSPFPDGRSSQRLTFQRKNHLSRPASSPSLLPHHGDSCADAILVSEAATAGSETRSPGTDAEDALSPRTALDVLLGAKTEGSPSKALAAVSLDDGGNPMLDATARSENAIDVPSGNEGQNTSAGDESPARDAEGPSVENESMSEGSESESETEDTELEDDLDAEGANTTLIDDVMDLVQDTTRETCEQFLSNPAVPDGSWMLRTSTLGWPNYLVLTFKYTDTSNQRHRQKGSRHGRNKRRGSAGKNDGRSSGKKMGPGTAAGGGGGGAESFYQHVDICRKVQGYFFSVAYNDPNAFEELEGPQGNRRRVRWCAERHYKLHEAVLRALRYYGLDRDACVKMGDIPIAMMAPPVSDARHSNRGKFGSGTNPGRGGRAQRSFVAKLSVTEGDLLPLLHDKILPPGVTFANAEYLPGSPGFHKNLKLITAMKRMEFRPPQRARNRNQGPARLPIDFQATMSLTHLFQDLYTTVAFRLRELAPCAVVGMDALVHLPADGSWYLQATLIGMAVRENEPALALPPWEEEPVKNHKLQDADGRLNLLPPVLNAEIAERLKSRHGASPSILHSTSGFQHEDIDDLEYALGGFGGGGQKSPNFAAARRSRQRRSRIQNKEVQLSPLGHIPGCRVVKYRGRINLHFIKESTELGSDADSFGGAFFHEFLSEANAMTRGQVAAVGGNTLLNYRLTTHESGGLVKGGTIYCMLSISGDAVKVATV